MRKPLCKQHWPLDMNATRKKSIKFIAAVCSLALLFCSAASATVLLDVSSSLTLADPTQLGRVFRNTASVSDWSVAKAFPGISSSSTSHHYRTYTIPAGIIGLARFVQISVDDPATTNFVVAYNNAFVPDSFAANRGLDVNYLGDNGGSGPRFGNMRYFQVVVPPGRDLVLHISEVSPSGGISQPFRILAEGFTDTLYTDSLAPNILSINPVNNTNLFFSVANGISNRNYRVLMGTNVSQPVVSWTPLRTNLVNANGIFSFTVTNTVSKSIAQRFYMLQLQ